MKKRNQTKKTVFITIIFLSIVLPQFSNLLTGAKGEIGDVSIKGFDKGPSYLPVVPFKKVTLVNYDEEKPLDDYAFVAAVPTAVFKDQKFNRLFSHPLLYYQDERRVEDDRERSLNARQGLDYFMEDWMSCCSNKLDEIIAINIPRGKLEQWGARKYTLINSDSPFEIAKKLALHDWSHSNNAVVTIIEEKYENPSIKTIGEINGILKASQIGEKHFKMQRPVLGAGATYSTFQIMDHGYKYVLVKMSWRGKVDYDLQLYDPKLGMVETAFKDFDYPEFEYQYDLPDNFFLQLIRLQ